MWERGRRKKIAEVDFTLEIGLLKGAEGKFRTKRRKRGRGGNIEGGQTRKRKGKYLREK